MSVLEQILKGAHNKAAEAGISVQGGHTIEDPEPKYGMVVCGGVHPEKVIRNFGARPGDKMILTKPLGTGILSTALKRGMVDEAMQNEVIAQMSALNRLAAEVMMKFRVNACTDITGFGLLGHLLEMSRASGVNAEIKFEEVPYLREVKALAAAGVIPGGTYNNLDYVKEHVDFGNFTRSQQLMLCDAQTSGGLLIVLPEEEADACLKELHGQGVPEAVVIGSFTAQGTGKITISGSKR